MISNQLKKSLYELDTSISEVARSMGIDPRAAVKAIGYWEGKTGNPRGQTRKILKEIEKLIDSPIYNEAE